MKQVKERNFITGALVLSMGGLFAKILGALYRIPLTNILGSYGMGLYQLVFPPYILMLTIAQAGVPTALSKLIAENNRLDNKEGSAKVFRFAFLLLLGLGVVSALGVALFSKVIAQAEGNVDTATCFIIIAPALVFVPVTNVLKGYFQGNMNMIPSSMTTVIEQVVKLAVGLTVASYFMPDVIKAVQGAVFAITISEFTSLVIMTIIYITKGRQMPVKLQKQDFKVMGGQVFQLALPVALGAFVMQMSQVIDSVMVVNLLSTTNATNLYGLWTGPVNSMLGLPIAMSAGVAVSALPGITNSYMSKDKNKLHSSYNSAIKLTVVIALPCALGLIVLSRQILSLLYGSLPNNEIDIAGRLLSLSGISVLFLAVMQTCVSVFQAINKPYVPVVALSLSIVVKAVGNLLLLPTSIGIYGSAVSETLCFFFACVVMVVYLGVKCQLSPDIQGCVIKPLAASLVMTLFITVVATFLKSFVDTKIGTVVTVGAAGIVYFVALYLLKVFDKNELYVLPIKQR